MFLSAISACNIQLIARETVIVKLFDAGDETPLIGVSIHIENQANNGTVMDGEGSFSMHDLSASDRLVFSYTSCQSSTKKVSGCQNGTILLEGSVSMHYEGILIGKVTQPREETTGRLSKLSDEEIQMTPSDSLESAMQGLSPGVMVNSESDKVGFNIDVKIRGISQCCGSFLFMQLNACKMIILSREAYLL